MRPTVFPSSSPAQARAGGCPRAASRKSQLRITTTTLSCCMHLPPHSTYRAAQHWRGGVSHAAMAEPLRRPALVRRRADAAAKSENLKDACPHRTMIGRLS
mmetsp:Transcript_18337/g.55340  ORF Transcript_18337/g.55340 Transcript_18337/m.55340 type:complete len:101 (+) Transcript_18337:341-643(+)|eukprot:scaffold276800_cov28-Tisochrysis_lutea.AAC.1